jgi:hypothetical protein
MTRECIPDVTSFSTVVAAAFVIRNVVVIGGIASFLVFAMIG